MNEEWEEAYRELRQDGLDMPSIEYLLKKYGGYEQEWFDNNDPEGSDAKFDNEDWTDDFIILDE